MAEATPIPRELQTPPQKGASGVPYFTDSAIDVEVTPPTISPQSKPPFVPEHLSASAAPIDTTRDQPERQACLAESSTRKLSNSGSETVHDQSEMSEPVTHAFDSVGSAESTLESDTELESHCEQGPELVSHLSTTVSSLRLRHQEQSHLQSLFTSKLEALAQRSLQHEASIHSLAAEIKSLRGSNTILSRENALLAHENNELRSAMQDLRSDLTEREMAMEAMTGAVRGLEGWIESANNSPQSNPQGRPRPDKRRYSRGKKEVIRGKGRFRGRYFIEDGEATGISGLGMDASKHGDTAEIQEGIMAWVRGFKDVEEGVKARNEGEGCATEAQQANGRPPADQDNDTTDTFDEEFGDFEASV